MYKKHWWELFHLVELPWQCEGSDIWMFQISTTCHFWPPPSWYQYHYQFDCYGTPSDVDQWPLNEHFPLWLDQGLQRDSSAVKWSIYLVMACSSTTANQIGTSDWLVLFRSHHPTETSLLCPSHYRLDISTSTSKISDFIHVFID